MSTKLCDRCKRRIKLDAISCVCGWSIASGAPVRPFIQCAYSGCGFEAIVRKGPSNFCYEHYVAQGNKEAKEYAETHGIVTAADHAEHIRALLATPKRHPRAWMENPKSEYAAEMVASIRGKRKQPVVERVPGEDDEPLALGIPLDELERELMERANP